MGVNHHFSLCFGEIRKTCLPTKVLVLLVNKYFSTWPTKALTSSSSSSRSRSRSSSSSSSSSTSTSTSTGRCSNL